MQTAAPEVQHRSSPPSSDSMPKTLGANAGRNALELSSCDTHTNTTPIYGCALPCPTRTFFVSLSRRPKQDGKSMRLISTGFCFKSTQTTNNSTRHGSARHVTSRLDADLFSLSSCRSAWLSLFFCRLPFPPPPPHPPVVPESAGANHHRLLPTKKSAVATFFFSLEEILSSISVLPAH